MGPKQRALQVIDQNAEQIADVGDSVWSFAEIGMQEHETRAQHLRHGPRRFGL